MLIEFGDRTFGRYLELDEVLSVGLSVQSGSVRTEQRWREGLELRCCPVSLCADLSHVTTPQERCHQADASCMLSDFSGSRTINHRHIALQIP